MTDITHLIAYLFIGLVILCYDVATDERCELHLSENGLLLVFLMMVGWPIWLGIVLYDWARGK